MDQKEHQYFVYIMASRSRTLYIGITSALDARVFKHKDGVYDGFSKTYRCDRLVWFERFGEVLRAIAREKQMKRWRREKKVFLIERGNPTWEDLSAGWGELMEGF